VARPEVNAYSRIQHFIWVQEVRWQKTRSSPSMCNIIVFHAQQKMHTSAAHQDEMPLTYNGCLDALSITTFADSCHYKCGFHMLIALTQNFKDKTFHQCCQLA